MPATVATSDRRSPGVRRRAPAVSPTCAGERSARHTRRNCASPARSAATGSVCPRAASAARAQGGIADASLARALPPPSASAAVWTPSPTIGCLRRVRIRSRRPKAIPEHPPCGPDTPAQRTLQGALDNHPRHRRHRPDRPPHRPLPPHRRRAGPHPGPGPGRPPHRRTSGSLLTGGQFRSMPW